MKDKIIISQTVLTMASDQGKIPTDLVLSYSLPLGIRAFRRRFISPASTQTAEPGNFVSIYPDTSTAGAFIDCDSTYLAFDIEFKNSHFCVDYTDFGVEGVGGRVIQEWRIVNQGTTLEEILNYPVATTTLTGLEGTFEKEVHLYFSSKLKRGYAEEAHINLIKPPMIDRSGNIMHGANPFGMAPGLANADHLYRTRASQGLGLGLPDNTGTMVWRQAGDLDEILELPAARPFFPGGSYSTFLSLGGVSTIVTAASFPETFSPELTTFADQFIWEYGSINKPQVMANLCNVKCFPIGMKGDKIGTIGKTSAPPTMMSQKYRICYRFYSGILGKMATKMLATTLLAPQQLAIQIRLADPQNVFEVSADPCRRVRGTCRDFIRNTGLLNGKQLTASPNWSIANTADVYGLTNGYDLAPGYSPSYYIPLEEYYSNPNTIFSTRAAKGELCLTNQIGDANATVSTFLKNTTQFVGGLPATPQYLLAKNMDLWNNITSAVSDTPFLELIHESEAFYGTYLKASVPQASRILAVGMKGEDYRTNSLSNSSITYTLSNIALVGDQLILPNESTADIIAAAEAGGYNVFTNSIRTYEMPITPGVSQIITCPFKVNMAKRIYFVFQNTIVNDQKWGYLYDSQAGLNPFVSIASDPSVNFYDPTIKFCTHRFDASTLVLDGAEGVGFEKPLVYTPIATTNPSNLSVQLRIGNDFFPQTALSSMQEIAVELTKTLEGWHTGTFSTALMGSVVLDKDGKTVFNGLENKTFTTVFTHHNLLDDQTKTGNLNMLPLWYAPDTIRVQGTSSNDPTKHISPRGCCIQGVFRPLTSSFILGFNLKSFKTSDGVDGGMYLGNSSITLLLNGTHGLAVPGQTYRAIGVIPHRALLRYGAGGQLVWAY